MVGAHDWIGNLVQNGAVDPVQLTEAQLAAFPQIAIDAVTFGGQIYGVPYALENVALFRNTDLAPEAPATIEELVETGSSLQADGKTSEILCLQVGDQRRHLPHLPPLHLGWRLPVRDCGRRHARPG